MGRLKTHPGEVLCEEFITPLGLSACNLGEAIGLLLSRIWEIARGRRDVSADAAIRLGYYFGTAPRFWLNQQTAHYIS